MIFLSRAKFFRVPSHKSASLNLHFFIGKNGGKVSYLSILRFSRHQVRWYVWKGFLTTESYAHVNLTSIVVIIGWADLVAFGHYTPRPYLTQPWWEQWVTHKPSPNYENICYYGKDGYWETLKHSYWCSTNFYASIASENNSNLFCIF